MSKTVHITVSSLEGITNLRLRIFPLDSGTIVNGPDGDVLIEDDNGHFTTTVDEAVTGIHEVDIVTTLGNVIWEGGRVDMTAAEPIVDAMYYVDAIGAFVGTPVVTRASLNIVFGKTNIDKWADADNDQDPDKISARVAWASNKARNYIEGRLARRYSVPFTSVPVIVINLIVSRTGIELFKSPRGLVDGNDMTAQINSINLEVESQLDQILAGTLQLIDATRPVEIPGVVVARTDFVDYRSKQRSIDFSGERTNLAVDSEYYQEE